MASQAVLGTPAGTFAGVQCGSVFNAAGVKSTGLLDAEGQAVLLKPSDWQEVIFEPKSFGNEADPKKMGVLIDPNEQLRSLAAELDCWAVQFIAANSMTIVGKQLSVGQVGMFYKPVLREPHRPGYPHTVKLKYIARGPTQTGLYLEIPSADPAAPPGRMRIDPAVADWKRALIRPVIRLRGIYSTTNGVGLSLETVGILFSGAKAAERAGSTYDESMFD